MDIREFAKLLKSNERRTTIRQFNEIQEFVSSINKKVLKNKKIRTHSRELTIVPQMVGRNIAVYNGKEFHAFDVTIEMLGHRLGEFVLTRNKVKHGAAGVGATKGSASKSVK
jgi:small subunit ribosomal protein S19